MNFCAICDEPIYSYALVEMCYGCTVLEQEFRNLLDKDPAAAKKWLKFNLHYLNKHHPKHIKK